MSRARCEQQHAASLATSRPQSQQYRCCSLEVTSSTHACSSWAAAIAASSALAILRALEITTINPFTFKPSTPQHPKPQPPNNHLSSPGGHDTTSSDDACAIGDAFTEIVTCSIHHTIDKIGCYVRGNVRVAAHGAVAVEVKLVAGGKGGQEGVCVVGDGAVRAVGPPADASHVTWLYVTCHMTMMSCQESEELCAPFDDV